MKLEKMRIIDLKKELKQRGLKGYSSLKKAQLIEDVHKYLKHQRKQ